jgi:hypothetical protein
VAPFKVRDRQSSRTAVCAQCGGEIYDEYIIEHWAAGKLVSRERVTRGAFRQQIDAKGGEAGERIPVCLTCAPEQL